MKSKSSDGENGINENLRMDVFPSGRECVVMETEAKIHQPCSDCGSSDALEIYKEGDTRCYSCGSYTPVLLSKDYSVVQSSPKDPKDLKDTTSISLVKNKFNYSIQYTQWRGVGSDTMKKYSTVTRVNGDGLPVEIVFPYGSGTSKVRSLKEKKFFWEGSPKDVNLFGEGVFPPGSARAIVITEGELDALSAYQMLGVPSVSVKNAQGAIKDCSAARDYLNSFEKIYLCLDNDAPGQEATKKVAALFSPGKVYHMKLGTFKDANEFLQAGKRQEFKALWLNTKMYLPEGIVGSYEQIEGILRSEECAPIGEYPFETLNQSSLGIRPSEVVLITAQEGVGKTEVIRSFEHHLLKTTDYNMGVIHLEEKGQRSVQGLIGYELRNPVHLPDSTVSVSDQLETYKTLTRKDGRLYLYPHFGSDDPNVILDIIRYMATACECKFIFLDHITMVVTGFETDDERKKLDFLSTRLAMLVTELDFTLFLVSHVNDDNKTRGSRNISKVSHLWLHLDRNVEAESLDARNTTKLTIKKNRFGGTTGPCGALFFDAGTFTLDEKIAYEKADEEHPF